MIKRIFQKWKGEKIGVRLSAGFVILVFILANTAVFWSNDVPIYSNHDQWKGFPIFRKEAFYEFIRKHPASKAKIEIKTLIPYSSTTIDGKNNLTRPAWFGIENDHILGTDAYSRDVLAGLIYGCRIVVWVAILSNIFAVIIAIILGMLAGYYKSDGVIVSKKYFLFFASTEMLLIYFFWVNPFCSQYVESGILRFAVFASITLLFVKIYSGFNNKKGSVISLPVDMIITKSIEIFQSIPGLLLIIGLTAMLGTLTIFKLTLLIALLRWPSLTRLVRGEVIKVIENNYVESAKALGFNDHQIMLRHILPNIARQIMIAVSFGVGSSILMESALSFLGLGLPPDQVTWGMLLSQARTNPQAWWLAVFPGILISLMILSSYTLGHAYAGTRKTKPAADTII